MKIKELYLKNFGKFSEQKFLIKEGINIFYGENEFGKTTIHSFIKGMLFGMDRGRGRSAKTDSFSKYEPWNNSNYYAGVLRFSCGQRTFCLERFFDKYSKKASLICEDDGEVLSIEDGDLEMLLDGMTPVIFENTVAIGQLQVETNQSLIAVVKDVAMNYYTTGSSDIHLQAAIEVLKKKKKDVEFLMKQQQIKRQEKREKLEFESSFIQKDIQKIQAEANQVEQDTIAITEGNQYQENEQTHRKKGMYKWRIHPMIYVVMIMLLLAPIIFLQRPWTYLWSIVIFLAEGVFVWNRLKDGQKKKRKKEEIIDETIRHLEWQKEHLKDGLKEKQILDSNLQEQLQELDEMDDTYKQLEQRKQAIELAMSQMNQIGQQLNKDFGSILNQKASEILAVITDNKYKNLFVDEELQMSLYKNNKRITLEQVSRGTLEQVYFSLRMAITELMFREEFPILLDDTFAFYDDQRLKRVLMWLSKSNKQILLFTCHTREEEIIKKL